MKHFYAMRCVQGGFVVVYRNCKSAKTVEVSKHDTFDQAVAEAQRLNAHSR